MIKIDRQKFFELVCMPLKSIWLFIRTCKADGYKKECS